MKKQITSFFMRNGVPDDTLTPTLTIMEVVDNISTIVVTSTMVSMNNGLYGFSWNNFDPNSEYVFQVDGGSTLDPSERYQIGTNLDFKDTWQASKSNHLDANTMGAVASTTLADVQQLRIDVTVIKNTITPLAELLELLRKHQTNRTVVDPVTNTLTVYEDDGVTPLQTFQLFDDQGIPSITSILERVPV